MKTRLSGCFLLMMAAQIGLSQGFWDQIGDMPEIRYAHTVNELNGKIYVVGGGTIEGSVAPATALVYDRSSGVWTQLPLYNNKARGGHGSAVVGGKLYVVGGADGNLMTLPTMDMFDPGSGQWVPKTPMPTARSLAACVALGGKIYVIGGGIYTGDYSGFRTVEVYDTSSGTWKQLADMPTGRWGHSAASVHGKIYVFGGATAVGGWQVFSSVEVYDPQTNTWTTKSNMPTRRYNLTTCVLDTNIYAIGGWLNSGSGPLYDKVEVYNPARDTFYTETPMPVARSLLASTVLDGNIVLYGGARTTHPIFGTAGIYEFQKMVVGLAYGRYARLLRFGCDTVAIAARVENPLAHALNVVGILTTGSGTFIDSVQLKDDGLHGDSSSADGLWGYLYVPKKDDTIHLTIRTDDLALGKSRKLWDAAALLFTRGALINVDTRTVDLHAISMTSSRFDTAFTVRNVGYAPDSLAVSVDPGNVIPDTAISAFPTLFALAPGDSQRVTLRIRPNLLPPQYYNAVATVEARSAFSQRKFLKNYMFQVVVSSVSDLAGLPVAFGLEQNYPNPFNPSTTIRYGLPRRSNVQLTLYNTLGQKVRTLVEGEETAGYQEVRFDGRDLAGGVYLYRLQTADFTLTRMMLLLK